MRTKLAAMSAAAALALALASGCVRIELEGEASAAADQQSLILSESGAVVLCPIAAAVSADGASYAALWHEYPASGEGDELHLMYARVSASGEVEVPATAVARLDGELRALSLVAIDGGFAVDLVRHGEGRRTAVAIDDAGALLRRLDADTVAEIQARAAGEGDVACGTSVQGPGETASAYRSQVGGELRLIFELQ